MSVFEFAMQMELDGKAYYEKMAENDKAKQVFTDFLEKFPNSSRKTEVQQHLSWLD